MPSEAVPVRGGEVVILQAPEGIAFTVEQAGADRITIRLGPAPALAPAADQAAASREVLGFLGGAGLGDGFDLQDHGTAAKALDFARRLGLLGHLATALAIARDCFPSARSWTLSAHESPPQVEINVTAPGTAEEVYRRHAECVERWVRHLPPDVLGKLALTEAFG